MTLLEDLEAIVLADSDGFRNLTGERVASLRAAATRLRMEIAVWSEVEPGMAYTGEVVNRCLERINGGPVKP